MSTNSTPEDLPTTELARAEGKDEDTPRRDTEARIQAFVAEITAAIKREDSFRKNGRHLVEMYEGAETDRTPFNILYSNTETIAPAIFNNTPRPVVKARYRKDDSVPKASADLAAGFLEFFIDTGDAEAPMFDDLISAAVHEALVPGRGVTRFDYDADIEYEEGAPKKVKKAYICGKHVPYDRFCHGYGKTWDQVPWVCFTHFLSKEEIEAKDRWKDKLEGISFSAKSGTAAEDDTVVDTEGVQLAAIHEFWDKVDRKVYFFFEGGLQFLEENDDEYGLLGFFPIPKPLTFVTKISSLTPVALYTMYETQAEELNSLTNRIRILIKAIKAVGFYNPLVEGFAKVLELEDGQLHPLEGAAALAETNLANAVWMWPVENMIEVLRELMLQREAVKQVIYEIMGISDILRGQSVPNETATAQSIKNQWGGLRIKKFQKEVARYVKDCLRIAAELGFSKLPKETVYKATATTLPYQKDWDAAKKRVQEVQEAAQQAQLAAPPSVPGQPPAPAAPPPQPSPNDLLLLQQPIFETILDGLKSDLHRKYLIDIELNSTVDVEATEDKTNLTDFLGAMAQFFAGVGPLVESKTLPWNAAKAMLLTISRKFRLGRDLDDELSSMQEPPQQGGEAAAEMAKVQAERQQLEKDKQAFAVAQIQAKAQAQMEATKLKVQSLQSAMTGIQRDASAAIAAVQNQIKDVKIKAQLDGIMKGLDAKHQQMNDDAAAVQESIRHDNEMDALERQKFLDEVRHENEMAAARQQAAAAVQTAKAAAAKKTSAPKGKK